MNSITMTEFNRHSSAVAMRVRAEGTPLIVTSQGNPVLELRPILASHTSAPSSLDLRPPTAFGPIPIPPLGFSDLIDLDAVLSEVNGDFQ